MTVPVLDPLTEADLADALPCDFTRHQRRCDHPAAWIVRVHDGHHATSLACVEHGVRALCTDGRKCGHCGVVVRVTVEPIGRAG